MGNLNVEKQLKKFFSPQELKEIELMSFEAIVKSAMEGNSKAQFQLGSFYFLGKYLKKNMERAFYWFDKSAEQGDIQATEVLKLWIEELNQQRSTKK